MIVSVGESLGQTSSIASGEWSNRLLASGFHLEKVESDPAVIYLLDSDSKLAYCNAAWDKFAGQNEGPELLRCKMMGYPVLDAVSDALRPFYKEKFSRVRESGTPWEHDYECSSLDLYRLFHMRVLPLQGAFLLIENSLRVERFHHAEDRVAFMPDVMYEDQDRLITVCAHCRRTQRAGNEMRWDWVPSYLVSRKARVSHGLCQNCRAFYFGI